MSAQFIQDTSVATNAPGPGCDTTVQAVGVGDTWLTGQWGVQYFDNDGMDRYYRYFDNQEDTAVNTATLRVRLLNSPLTNVESDDTSGAAIAGQSFQTLAEAIDANGQVGMCLGSSAEITISQLWALPCLVIFKAEPPAFTHEAGGSHLHRLLFPGADYEHLWELAVCADVVEVITINYQASTAAAVQHHF